MHDRFRKKFRAPGGGDRRRRQIALEAGRRLMEEPEPEGQTLADRLDRAGEADLYLAKRKAAAVLGHRVRPGDLPSDDEVRAELVLLWRAREAARDGAAGAAMPEPDEASEIGPLSARLDRFAVYRLRLEPLEAVKQNAKHHPEGDALYHSLQVFHLAREARPYDEEFLLAALLHDVGKAIDAQDHVAAGVEALRGSVTQRTLWLIEHHMGLLPAREKNLSARQRRELESSEYFDDLRLLRDLDDRGRVPGLAVASVDEALAYLRGLEREAYLDD